MPLIRGHHSFDDHFTQIPNDWVRDSRLSLKARGLLAMLMSHRQGWSLSIASIANNSQEGKDAIRSAITELEELGYLSRDQINENGRFGEAVWITQDPADLPSSGFPPSDNPPTKNNNLKEEQVKNTNKKIDEFFNEFWNSYPLKRDKAKAYRAFKSALSRATFEDIMAGVIAYRQDPKRNPDFTKYPASWLNADAWENAATRAESSGWREKEIAHSKAYLEEMEKLKTQAAPPPKCRHGKNLALCSLCVGG
jgi:hypothetical protein